MKLTAAQGIVLVTLILGVLGGVLNEVSTYIQTLDLSWLGPYAVLVKAFFAGAPYIIAVTWLYNIFGYLMQNQMVKSTPLPFDTQKFVQTLTLFISTIGPIFMLAPTPELKAIGSLIVFIATALLKTWQNITTQMSVSNLALTTGPNGIAEGVDNGSLVFWYPGQSTQPAGTIQVPYGLSMAAAQAWITAHPGGK
ncbi:MAG: hypothetical protein ABSC91_10760 [Candidatus Bathyarchaeia archaeon]|jgi:hypothetical protein